MSVCNKNMKMAIAPKGKVGIALKLNAASGLVSYKKQNVHTLNRILQLFLELYSKNTHINEQKTKV